MKKNTVVISAFAGILLTIAVIVVVNDPLDLSENSESWRIVSLLQEKDHYQKEKDKLVPNLKEISKLEGYLNGKDGYVRVLSAMEIERSKTWGKGGFMELCRWIEKTIRLHEKNGAKLYSVAMKTPETVVFRFLKKELEAPSQKCIVLTFRDKKPLSSRIALRRSKKGASSGQFGVLWKEERPPKELGAISEKAMDCKLLADRRKARAAAEKAQRRKVRRKRKAKRKRKKGEVAVQLVRKKPVKRLRAKQEEPKPSREIFVEVRFIDEQLVAQVRRIGDAADVIEPARAPIEYLGKVNGQRQWRILPSEGVGRP